MQDLIQTWFYAC